MSSTLFDHEFRTARAPRLVYCHQEFLDKLAARRNEGVGKRAALLLQRMAVDIARIHYKSTSGANRGWRRSRLGGGSGSHFYAWWAPGGAAPVQQEPFAQEAEAVFLRDIRHHDDHAPLTAGDFGGDYLPLSVPDLRGDEYTPQPWTPAQAKFARSRAVARILKGHPGSGKTSALLHAADESQAERVLYLTFSPELAALARDYFDRFCSGARTFTVLTYPVFLRQLVNWQGTSVEPAESRAQFRRDLAGYQRSLGPWANDLDALYDEIHAHGVGAALPEKAGRFPKAERMCLPDAAYRTQRDRFLGAAAEKALEAVHRLNRPDAPMGDRYFPELALAWRAAQALSSGTKVSGSPFLEYGCLAVDEVQDLTPLELFVVLALSRAMNGKGRHAPLLLAGDEAQTVRPTDFEWAWLNDMLHEMLGTAQEFKLAANLRSPRRIAELVNRAWDYYDYLHKQDRPSGSGAAEIDDDSPDQVLYAAVRGAELPQLLTELSVREGLAIIAFDKTTLAKDLHPFVLSPAEAKGLDFHSVCVVNGGALLRGIATELSVRTVDSMAKRTAIDQLRVALSRPTERLIWVDADASPATVDESSRFLHTRGDTGLRPMSIDGLRASLQEEELDLEERVQLCQRDARQLVDVKPDLAWSRAHQAVNLLRQPRLGGPEGPAWFGEGAAAHKTAALTLAEVCFQLAFRKKTLSPELGQPNLFGDAAQAARSAGKFLFANLLQEMGEVDQAFGADKLNKIARAIELVVEAKDELPAWLIVEITPRADIWMTELERNLEAGDNPLIGQRILPPFIDVIGFADAQARKERLAKRAVQILMKNRRFVDALSILEKLPESQPGLAAKCYEEVGQFGRAAESYLGLGDQQKALDCYRAAPDFAAALALVRKMETHAAKPSLEWLAEMEAVLARRPENFNRVMTTPEKKLLEKLLEQGLGVQRKKPAAKKAPATKKKAAAKPARKPLPGGW